LILGLTMPKILPASPSEHETQDDADGPQQC
jgi:hypothetical protein